MTAPQLRLVEVDPHPGAPAPGRTFRCRQGECDFEAGSPGAIRGHMFRDHPGSRGEKAAKRLGRGIDDGASAPVRALVPAPAPEPEAKPAPEASAPEEPAQAPRKAPVKKAPKRRPIREAAGDSEAGLDMLAGQFGDMFDRLVESRREWRNRARTAEAEVVKLRKIIVGFKSLADKVSAE